MRVKTSGVQTAVAFAELLLAVWSKSLVPRHSQAGTSRVKQWAKVAAKGRLQSV